ncbi:hypothetical protein ARMGADRAFT_1169341 [Armillaria gallica]|uniref:Uncharacterized protein n=1 Tax=Armillaria gallica TaxID=47427 RepID=A0A2H3CS38_ARMGA|nr:hypothetical protein ARMGADRAFT_1169341 [Armillaria gallica]
MDNLRSLSLPSFGTHVSPGRDGQTNVVPLRFPFLIDDDDDGASPPTSLPATPTHPRLLSAPTTPSQSFLFSMPPLSPLPPTPTQTQDTFTHTGATLLPNLTTLQDPPHLIIFLVLSRPLIDLSITISALIHGEFRPTTTLESLPPSIRRLCFTFKSVGKRTQEKTLRSAIVREREARNAAQVETAKEELDERLPLPKRARTQSTLSTIGHSDHSMVVSERACAAHLANACPALQSVVFSNGVQWRRPSSSLPLSRLSPCLPFDDLFVKKIDRNVPPPPPLRKVVPLAEQRFLK